MLTVDERAFFLDLQRENDNLVIAGLEAMFSQGVLAQEPSIVKRELAPLVVSSAWTAASIGSMSYQASRGNALGASASAFIANPVVRAGIEVAVDATIDWGLKKLSESTNVQSALDEFKGGLTRHARSGGRTTLEQGVRDDPDGAMYRRVPRAGGCEWCLMLASRGYVYSSKSSALVASGERGDQPVGDKFHDWCSCSSEPQFRNEDPPEFVQFLESEWQRLNWVGGKPAYSADVAFDNWYQHVHMGGLGDRPAPKPVGRPSISTNDDPQ